MPSTNYYAYTSSYDYNNGRINMYSINSLNGNWTPLSPSSIDISGYGGSVSIITQKINNINYVYALTNYATSYIITYYANPNNGQLVYVSKNSYSQTGFNAINTRPLSMSIVLNNNNYYLYISNTEATGTPQTVSAFSINSSNGTLSPLSPFTININDKTGFINTINTGVNGSYAYVTQPRC